MTYAQMSTLVCASRRIETSGEDSVSRRLLELLTSGVSTSVTENICNETNPKESHV